MQTNKKNVSYGAYGELENLIKDVCAAVTILFLRLLERLHLGSRYILIECKVISN